MEADIIHSEMSTRYSDSHWWKPGEIIMIIGLGNIGSWLSLMLSKLEPRLFLYDFDRIEEHNIGVTPYPFKSIGSLKTEAAQDLINSCSPNSLPDIHLLGAYDEESFINKVVFTGADNMTARKIAFEKWVEIYGNDPSAIFIDGRSTMEFIQTFNVVGGRQDYIEKYRESLFSDEEDIGELPCGAKSSSHFGAIIAGLMVTAYTNHLSNLKLGDNIKVIPFNTTFNGLSFDLDKEVSYE
jgi:hypothetical protein